jgi:hypothetical protein
MIAVLLHHTRALFWNNINMVSRFATKSWNNTDERTGTAATNPVVFVENVLIAPQP